MTSGAGGQVRTVATVVNEVAKMRRLRVLPVAALLVAGTVALTCIELTSPTFAAAAGDPAGRAWERLLAAASTAAALVAPLLVAVLAGRQVDIEHQGGGWLLSRAAGVGPGRLCRAKFAAVGAVLLLAAVAQGSLVVVAGRLAGVTTGLPVAVWTGWVAVVAVAHLALLTAHLVLATVVENQLVGLGAGVLGVFAAASASGMPAWAAHLHPWGWYALSAPVDWRDGVLVDAAPSPAGIAAVALAVAAAFLLVTRHLDHREH